MLSYLRFRYARYMLLLNSNVTGTEATHKVLSGCMAGLRLMLSYLRFRTKYTRYISGIYLVYRKCNIVLTFYVQTEPFAVHMETFAVSYDR